MDQAKGSLGSNIFLEGEISGKGEGDGLDGGVDVQGGKVVVGRDRNGSHRSISSAIQGLKGTHHDDLFLGLVVVDLPAFELSKYTLIPVRADVEGIATDTREFTHGQWSLWPHYRRYRLTIDTTRARK